MKKVTFTRGELHQLVWSESLPTLSKKFDSTYHELRNLCIDMNIPLPKAGYWQNKSLGRAVVIEPLLKKSADQDKVTLMLLEEGDEHKPITKRSSKVIMNEAKEDLFTVPLKLTKPDPLVAAAQNSLSKKKAGYNKYERLVSTGSGEIDISVAPKNVGRALRFMDTLIKIFRVKDYDIKFRNGDTIAVIKGEEIKISLKEMNKRVPIENPKWSWETYDLVPTGIFSFRMGENWKQVMWKEGSTSIEEKLPKIIAKLEALSDQKKKECEEREKYWAEQKEKERLRLEIQQKREKEIEDFKRLLADAERWEKAKMTRNYIDAIEMNAISKGAITEELKAWLAWARNRIDNYDPLINHVETMLSP